MYCFSIWMHWPAAVLNLFLCTKSSNNCMLYQQKEKRRKISRAVNLWNIKELNLKKCSLIIASKFSKCLYLSLFGPRYLCVSCLIIFRIYSNFFCFSPCACFEFAVSLKEVLPCCCGVSEHCSTLFCRKPASSVMHSQVPYLQTCIFELFLFTIIHSVQILSVK